MFVRNALKFGTFLFVLNLVDKLLLSRVKVRSILLDARYLKALLQEDRFVSLYISNAFSRKVGNDQLSFLGYLLKKEQTGQMQRIHLETTEDGLTSPGAKVKYSSYNLTREVIEKLTSAYPQAFYFLLRPMKSLLDEDYISFEIVPADKAKRPFPKRETSVNGKASMLQNEPGQEPQTEQLRGEEADFGGNYLLAGTLNPSPPAVASFEVDF
jgi:hypothetical protein